MKKIVIFVLVMLVLAATLMYKYFGDIKGFQGDLNHPAKVQELKSFIADHDQEYVVLSLMLSSSMNKELALGLKKSPSVLLPLTKKHEDTLYVLQQSEGGKREFIFDENSGKLQGLFHVEKRQIDQGQTYIFLSPINPKKIK